MRVIMRLDDETFWRYATECNYEIWWSPKVGGVVRESKIAEYLERSDPMNAVRHRSQNALLELTSFRARRLTLQAGRPRARRSAAVRGFFCALRSAAPIAGRSHSRIASGPSTASSGAR